MSKADKTNEMEPLKIKIYGLVPLTKKQFLISYVIMGVPFLFMFIYSTFYKTEISETDFIGRWWGANSSLIWLILFVWLVVEAQFYWNQFTKRQLEIIEEQKKIISENNLLITDSISYASRIQMAVVPPQEKLKEFFSDYFIFWKPCQIVSGDFYWMRKQDEKLVVCVADCTGHGVPGAFMSLLGITMLNDIAKHTRIISAATILNDLRREVISALNQSGRNEKNRDGMDIALCVFDFKNQEMNYAGAYNPIYIISNGQFNEIKATRTPIGEYIKEDPFNDHYYKWQTGDCFYLFTDGFADQTGGPEGEKFKYQRFREMFKEIGTFTMARQKDEISTRFNNWKGNKEQIDDVLIMGLKL